jgi:6-phosphogluconolactonase (cycloisomerase 2 family)
MRKSLPTIGLIALLAACGTAPSTQPATVVTTPIQTMPIAQPKPAKALGLVEVRFTDVGKDSFSAQAVNIKTTKSGLSAQALTDVTAGLQLSSSPVARGSTDVGVRGAGGQRYIYTTFRVRNASGDASTDYAAQGNLAFVAVETVAPATPSVTGTAIRNLRKFDGTAFSSLDTDAIAPNILPASPVTMDAFSLKPTVIPNGIDAMQVFSESEAGDLKTVLSPSSGSGVNDVLPYGFVVTNTTNKTRTLPAPANATDFAGAVTFAVKVPLQASAAQDPYSFSMMFEVVSDSSNRVTQSLEGQDDAGNAAVKARAQVLGAGVTTLGGSALGTPTCSVRGAGPASSPLSYLVNALPFPSVAPTANSNTALSNANLDFGFTATMNALNSSGLTVNASQTGLRSGTYSGDGTTALGFDPASDFKPGEEVEVRLGNPTSSVAGQGLCQSKVWRFRAGVAAGGGVFTGAQYGTGPSPASVVVRDVNGDSKLDMIVPNFNSNSVSVLKGNGDGTFQIKVDYTTGSSPRSVALSDVNGDGKLDMMVANYSDGNASVLKGNGDGTFQTKVDYTTGSNPASVVVRDVNGDSKLDMMVANFGSSSVSVLKGNGDGTFQTKVDYTTGSNPVSVALSDVNADLKLDLIVANFFSNSVSVLKGGSNGTFQTKVDYTTGSKPASVVVRDVNGDLNQDLIVANYGSNSVSVLKGVGDGTFQTKVDSITGAGPQSVVVDYVNADGRLDVTTANTDSNSISVLNGNGDGTFQGKVDYATGSSPQSVALADVNSDGKLDVMVSNRASNSVSVLKGNGDGTFQTNMDYTAGANPVSVVLGDVNGDGKLDLMTANSGSSSVSVLLNR